MDENKSLAQFVSERREKMGLSPFGLAKKCNLPIEIIESIEASQDLFLASTIRQKLAKGLKLNPIEIKIYEKNIDTRLISDDDEEKLETLKIQILDGQTDLKCPICGYSLISKIALMYDLKDNPITHPKAKCSSCPFQIK